MKKALLVFLSAFLCFVCFASERVVPKTVISNPSVPVCNNPAYVSFYDLKYNVKLSGELTDELSFKNPALQVKTSVVGNNLAAGINASFLLENPIPVEASTFYDSVEKFDLDVCFSAGFSHFSAGAGVSISSRLSKKGIEVRDGHKLYDIFRQAVQEHDRDKGGSEAKVRLGLMYNYKSLWAGVMCDDIYTMRNGFSHFSFKTLLDSMTAGLSYCGSLYGERARINLVSFTTSAEVSHLSDLNQMEMLVGGRIVVQYVRERTVFIEGWYKTKISSLDQGNATICAGAGIDNFFVNLTYNTLLSSKKESPTFSIEISSLF